MTKEVNVREVLEDEIKRNKRIRVLNDHLRQTLSGGRVVLTDGILALEPGQLCEVLQKVSDFTDFSQNSDPYGEHDFGAFDSQGTKIFWKIDYYDKEYRFGSPDPADHMVTARVLTILLASEY